MGIIAGLATVLGVVLDFVSGTAQTALDIAKLIFDLLSNFIHYTMQIVQSLLNYQQQQPVAFILVVGTTLVMIILAPFIVGVNYNHLLFGYTKSTFEEQSAMPSTIANMTLEELTEFADSLRLTKLTDTPTIQPLLYDERIPAFIGSQTTFGKMFPLTSQLAQKIATPLVYGSSIEETQLRWSNLKFDMCGKRVNASNTSVVWEMKIVPTDPDLANRLKASAQNPQLRLYNATASCTIVTTNASAEISLPGATPEMKATNLKLFLLNGSLCEDKALENLKPKVYIPGGTPITQPFGWFFSIYTFALNLWKKPEAGGVNVSDCYIVLENTTRKRWYGYNPEWVRGGASENLTAMMLYGDSILTPPTLTTDELIAIGVVGYPVIIESRPGFIDAPLTPYRLLNDSANAMTGGATVKYFIWFQDGVIIMIMLLIGLVGVALVLNTQRINLRK